MRSAQLHPGLPIEVDVRGQKFNATVKGVDRGRVSILPFEAACPGCARKGEQPATSMQGAA